MNSNNTHRISLFTGVAIAYYLLVNNGDGMHKALSVFLILLSSFVWAKLSQWRK